MITMKTASLIAAGLCIVGLSIFANQKNPVDRPHKAVGQFHAVIHGQSFVADGVGTGTHTGQFYSHLEGGVTWGPNGPLPSSGSGFVEAANGDRLLMKVESDGSTTVYDGTGRFKGATGHQTATNIGEPSVDVDPDTGAITIDAIQLIQGTLTY